MRLGPLVLLVLSVTATAPPRRQRLPCSQSHRAQHPRPARHSSLPPQDHPRSPTSETTARPTAPAPSKSGGRHPPGGSATTGIPGFHLTEITDGPRHWQHSEGDYFPSGSARSPIAIVQPVPNRDRVLDRIKTAEVRSILGSSFSWMEFSSSGDTRKAMGAALTLTDNSGLLAHGGGFGWGFESKDYTSFHKLLVARTVSAAKITTLEDLGSVPAGLFDTTQPAPDSNPITTLPIEKSALPKKSQPIPPPAWPALKMALSKEPLQPKSLSTAKAKSMT